MNRNKILKDYFNLNNRNNVSRKNKGVLRYNDTKINVGPIYIFKSSQSIKYTKFQEIYLRRKENRIIWTGYFYCNVNEKNKNELFNLLEIENKDIFLDLNYKTISGNKSRLTYVCKEVFSKQLSSFTLDLLREKKFDETILMKFKASNREW
jgi:hypothetical protein